MAREKTYQTDIRKARKKAKRKKSLKKLAGFTVIVCIALVVVLTSQMWLPKLRQLVRSTADNVVKSGAKVEAGEFPIAIGETNSSEIYTYGDRFILVTDTNITIYDSDGNKIRSIQHSLADPIGVAGGNMLLLYDLGGYSLMAVNDDGEVYRRTFSEKIIMAELGAKDYAAIVTQTDKYLSYMTVYDPKGNEAFLWSGGQRIADVTMNAEGNGCVVSTFKAEGGEIVSSVTSLNFMQSDPLFTIDNIPAMIYDTVLSDDSVWVVGDSKLIHYATDGSVISQYDYNTELTFVDADSKTAAVVEKSVTKGTFDLTIANSSSSDIHQFSIENECRQITCKDGLVYILMNGQIAVFDNKGEQLATYDVSPDYQSFVFIDDAMYVEDYSNIYKVTFE